LRLFLAYVIAGITPHLSPVTAATLIIYAISIHSICHWDTRKTRSTRENFRGRIKQRNLGQVVLPL
jgi:hypothetical protein